MGWELTAFGRVLARVLFVWAMFLVAVWAVLQAFPPS